MQSCRRRGVTSARGGAPITGGIEDGCVLSNLISVCYRSRKLRKGVLVLAGCVPPDALRGHSHRRVLHPFLKVFSHLHRESLAAVHGQIVAMPDPFLNLGAHADRRGTHGLYWVYRNANGMHNA